MIAPVARDKSGGGGWREIMSTHQSARWDDRGCRVTHVATVGWTNGFGTPAADGRTREGHRKSLQWEGRERFVSGPRGQQWRGNANGGRDGMEPVPAAERREDERLALKSARTQPLRVASCG